MCSKNGGLFIKAGQIVAALDYLFPREYVEVFKLFHSDAPMTPLNQLKSVLVRDLGKDAEELIEHFEPQPLGAASLAQCHKVLLKDGRTMAMKIQHPNVKTTCSGDIKTIEVWLWFVDGADLDQSFVLFVVFSQLCFMVVSKFPV